MVTGMTQDDKKAFYFKPLLQQ